MIIISFNRESTNPWSDGIRYDYNDYDGGNIELIVFNFLLFLFSPRKNHKYLFFFPFFVEVSIHTFTQQTHPSCLPSPYSQGLIPGCFFAREVPTQLSYQCLPKSQALPSFFFPFLFSIVAIISFLLFIFISKPLYCWFWSVEYAYPFLLPSSLHHVLSNKFQGFVWQQIVGCLMQGLWI